MPNTLSPEASEILTDPVVIESLKESFLSAHKEYQQLNTACQEACERIRQQPDAFTAWFIEECVRSEYERETNPLVDSLNHLRNSILSVDQKYVKERRRVEKLQDRIAAARAYPISDIVSRYIELKKSASRLVGCCPFHHEKNASFTIFPKSNSAYCFGCGWSGDVIKFVMDYNDLSFKETLAELS